MTIITAIVDVRKHTGVPGNATIELTPIGTIGGIKLADGRRVPATTRTASMRHHAASSCPPERPYAQSGTRGIDDTPPPASKS